MHPIVFYLLLVLLPVFSHTHKGCIHDQIIKGAKLTPVYDHHQARLLQTNAYGYGPIRIYFIYNTTDIQSTDNVGKNIMKMMNIIDLYWQKTLQVDYGPSLSFNVDPSIDKNNFQCLTFTVPYDVLTNPIPNKDYGVLVQAKDDGASGVTAYSYPCAYSVTGSKPLWGLLHWNKNYFSFDLLSFQMNLVIGIHQMTHNFGFTSLLYSNYLKGKLVTTPKGSFINGSYMQQALRLQYGCTSAPGMLLESNGGPGTSMSHWSYKAAYNEYMTAGVLLNNPTISYITIALLQQTGWYRKVFKTYGKFLNWGYQKGCAMLDPTNCTSDEYCSNANLGVKGCDYDQTALGYCKNQSLTACLFFKFYQNFLCIDPNYASGSLNAGLINSTGQKGGVISRCFDSTLILTGSTAAKYPFRCYPTRCSPTKRTLSVQVGSKYALCLFPRQKISVPGYDGVLTCPKSFKNICAVQRCPAQCNANGVCLHGKCLCAAGYAGQSCSDASVAVIGATANKVIGMLPGENKDCQIGSYLTDFGDCQLCPNRCATCNAIQCTLCLNGVLPGSSGC